MAVVDLLIINGYVFLEGRVEKNIAIAVNKGKIIAIGRQKYLPEGKNVLDLRKNLIIPGSIDPHVHLRDPGRTDRETFITGTMAAAAGGVTTIIEHPISTPPQYSPSILKNRIDIASKKSLVDFAFYGAAGADHLDMINLLAQKGIVAFKTFLLSPPVGREKEFEGLTMSNDSQLLSGFSEIEKAGLICAVHAENDDIIKKNISILKSKGRTDYLAHCDSRPPVSEIEAVKKVISIARATNVKVEFVHISTPSSMELIKKSRNEGLNLILETCPHYLFLTEKTIAEHGPFAKCNPPLRKEGLSKKLWKYINDGTVDFIGSDHAPFLLKEKMAGLNNIFAAPSGFPGIQLRLPLIMNAVSKGKLSLKRAVELISVNPAKIFALYPQKGIIQVGADADFTVIDLDREFRITEDIMKTKAKSIARVYKGLTLQGLPIHTIVRGKMVMKDNYIDKKAVGWGEFVSPFNCQSD